MARFVDPPRSRENIDRLVELWKERCLLGDGSLLFDDRAIWSLANLQDFRHRFTGPAAIYGTGETFEEKLAKQLAYASDDVRLLAAELLVVHFLFAYVAIGTEAKIAIVRDAAGGAWEDEAPGWMLVEAALGEGIGNPGSGYNIRRDIQVSYLLDFAIRWKALSAEEQQAKLEDPWALREFADDAGTTCPTAHSPIPRLTTVPAQRISAPGKLHQDSGLSSCACRPTRRNASRNFGRSQPWLSRARSTWPSGFRNKVSRPMATWRSI